MLMKYVVMGDVNATFSCQIPAIRFDTELGIFVDVKDEDDNKESEIVAANANAGQNELDNDAVPPYFTFMDISELLNTLPASQAQENMIARMLDKA